MRTLLLNRIALLVWFPVLAAAGCAQMFNSGSTGLVHDSPSNRKVEASTQTDFDNLKVDPLMLAEVKSESKNSAATVARPTRYDQFGSRKPLDSPGKFPFQPKSESARLEPIVESTRKKVASSEMGRKPILLRAIQGETASLPPVGQRAPPPVDEMQFSGTQPSLLTPQLVPGGDFVAPLPPTSEKKAAATTFTPPVDFAAVPSKQPRDAKRNSESRKVSDAELLADLGFDPVPPFAHLPGTIPEKEIDCQSTNLCLKNPEQCGDADLGLTESAHGGGLSDDTRNSDPAEQGFLEKMISSSVEMEAAAMDTGGLTRRSDQSTMEVTANHIESEPPKLNWRSQLSATIDVFQDEIDQADDDALAKQLETGLGILQSLERYHAAGCGDDCQSTDEIRRYWAHQILAINEMLKNSDTGSDVSRSASQALKHLQDAVHELAAVADLKLTFAIFCTKVTGFGQYQPPESVEFRSDQEILVYCEIDNFAPLLETKAGTTNYQTRISSSFWITDDAELVVQQQDFPVVTDDARNLRRDFFMHLPIKFADLPPGAYRLYVKVRDLGSGKDATLAQPLIFSIH